MTRGRAVEPDALMASVDATEAALLRLTTDLAALIRAPAQHWDPTAIAVCWDKIASHKSTIRRMMSALHNVEIDGRRNGVLAKDLAIYRKRKNRLKRQLKLWDRMADCVAQHIKAADRPMVLYRPEAENDRILARFHTYLHKLANPHAQSQNALDHKCFADIPMPLQPFETMIQLAQRFLRARDRLRGARFLDVGCGGGTKVLAAKQYFDHADGLEYDPAYADAGAKTLALLEPDCQMIQGDALTFEGYAAYDVIYFYRPIQDDGLLQDMERRIAEMVKPGTILVAPYNSALEPHRHWTVPNLIGPIFAPGLTEDAAQQWMADAAKSDHVSLAALEIPSFGEGIWAPLTQVAKFNW